MSALGLVLLLLVALLVPATGLPAFLVLIGAAVIGATVGVVGGTIPPNLLAALPARIVNLLENDLLQALPLYVLVGALLNRLPVADALFQSTVRVFRGQRAAPAMAGIALGALLGPMNGSVGASVVALSRTVAPRLAETGMAAPARHALLAVASTLGIVLPPSLVLILLGDAMMAAHTVAVNAAGRSERIINTQDLFRGALVPAGLFLLLCLIVAASTNRAHGPATKSTSPVGRRVDAWIALAAVAFVAVLLIGVATGRFYAVEGAAAGAFTLFFGALLTGRLAGGQLPRLLGEVMATTGALFALLVAATSFTLVFRALGTDKLLDAWIAAAPLPPVMLTGLVLAAIALAGLALDAFEIIFVLVPVLMPPLLTRVTDASWVAVLVLLALQASFLVPPIGYALLMTRGVLAEHVGARALAGRLAPYLAAQFAVLAAVLAFPVLVHLGEPAGAVAGSAITPALSDEDAERRMQEMLAPPSAPDNATGEEGSNSAMPR